ncbi:unnamed protein product, partial [Heterotrigona itama]
MHLVIGEREKQKREREDRNAKRNGRLNKMDDKRKRVQSNEAYSRGIDGGMMERIESGIHRLYGGESA